MRLYFLLLRKDLTLEFRSREMLSLLFLLALLLSVVVASGLQNSALSAETMARLFAVVVWVIFLFNATLSIERSFDGEKEEGAIEGLLLLAGIPAASFYCAKVTSNSVIMMIAHLFTAALLSVLMDVPLMPILLPFLLLSVLLVFAYSCAATLLAGLAMTARLKSLLLPLILLPLLFPLFFAATELTSELIAGRFDPASPWLSLVFGLDVVYFLLGVNLFGYVLKE